MSLSINSSIMSGEHHQPISLTSFRIAHNSLLRKYREQGNASDVLHEIAQLIRTGKTVGRLLDSDNDRWACQGLLDYWSSMLYRAGYESPNATLDEFDPIFAPDLDKSLYPYADIIQRQSQATTLSATELRAIIEKPAELIGLKFEEGLLDTLVQDILHESNQLSLLQFILFKLWEQRDHNKITWDSYNQVGRGKQSLIQVADQLANDLSVEELQALKQIMLNLAQFGAGAGLVTRKISRSELYELLGVSNLTSSIEVNPLETTSIEFCHSSELAEASINTADSANNELPSEFSQVFQTLTSDDPYHFESNLPEVQDRFQALLKLQLHRRATLNPPLFPWETQLEDIMEEDAAVTTSRINIPGFWSPQLAHLQLPVLMSTSVLEKLLERCQALLASPLREGAKLVQAVESLFPGEVATLNQLTGMVLISPTRSGNRMIELAESSGLPEHYDSASPRQQMVLSLLAAREIFNLFIFHLSSQKPVVKYRWETVIGAFVMRISYKNNQLLVEARLPSGGKLSLYNGTTNVSSQRSNSGYLSTNLANPSLENHYSVKIQVDEPNRPLITFVIQIDS